MLAEDVSSSLLHFMRQMGLLEYYQMLRSDNNQSRIVEVKDGKIIGLNFADLSIDHLPESIDQFEHLEVLNLASCKLSDLPDQLINLRKLRILNLENNEFNEFPVIISQLDSIEELNLSRMGWISNLSGFTFASLSRLRILKISSVAIKTIRGPLQLPSELEKLDISLNHIREIEIKDPSSLRLQMLDLSANKLSEFPANIQKLEFLTQLNLDDNRIADIPGGLDELEQLVILSVANNKIHEIPRSIIGLPSIKILILESNQIQTIPSEIGKMSKLEEIWLGNNSLQTLPEEIGDLHNLKILRLSDNDIGVLPKNLLTLYLEELNLTGNNLPTPFNFLAPDADAVFNYFARICHAINRDDDLSLLQDTTIREISKIHIFLDTGEALLSYNGLTESLDEMDLPLAGLFQLAMNIIDTEGKDFIPIKDKNDRSILITVNNGVGLGFDFLGLHSTMNLQGDYYLRNAIENFVHHHGDTLRNGIVELTGKSIQKAFMLYLKTT